MKYPQCTGKAAGRERKQIKVLKLSNLFFFFFVIILNLYIIYCQKFSVDSISLVFFYSKILVSLTCNYKTLISLQVKCMAWSITWEYILCTLYSYIIHIMDDFSRQLDYKFWRNYSELSDIFDYREHSQRP